MSVLLLNVPVTIFCKHDEYFVQLQPKIGYSLDCCVSNVGQVGWVEFGWVL